MRMGSDNIVSKILIKTNEETFAFEQQYLKLNTKAFKLCIFNQNEQKIAEIRKELE